MAGSLLSESTLAERDMALVLREAELNRREAALRRAEEAGAEDEGLTRRLRSSSRRSRLDSSRSSAGARAADDGRGRRGAARAARVVRSEYQLRRDGLAPRTREVEAERNRLRDEQAQLVCASLELEDAGRPAGPGTRRPRLRPRPGAGDRACTQAGRSGHSWSGMPARCGRCWWPSSPGRRLVDQAARLAARSRVARRSPSTLPAYGALAQLGERRLCKAEVIGSIPIRSTYRKPR